ncbi:MAG: nucleotidyltransferase domain-containing protein [Planctomycetes bacterium]|nr:nucleotidyltransferase domain-containing protein [Planctomycetota bacterium]
MDLQPCVDSIRRYTAELLRRNAQAQEQARSDLPAMVEVIRATRGVKRAYLYGSLAKQAFHPQSDVDIAVEGLRPGERDDLKDRLSALTRFPVDVRNLDSSPEFRELIEFYGELLHAQP